MNTDKTSLETQNQPSCLVAVMRFYFMVNNSKLDNPEIMERQINKICNRLIKRHNIKSKNIGFYINTINDDFFYDRCRLEISFNCW
jgi:hypothetical protein